MTRHNSHRLKIFGKSNQLVFAIQYKRPSWSDYQKKKRKYFQYVINSFEQTFQHTICDNWHPIITSFTSWNKHSIMRVIKKVEKQKHLSLLFSLCLCNCSTRFRTLSSCYYHFIVNIIVNTITSCLYGHYRQWGRRKTTNLFVKYLHSWIQHIID